MHDIISPMEGHAISKKRRVIQWMIIGGVILMVITAVAILAIRDLKPRQLVSLGSTVFQAEVVDTQEKRSRGLSGRRELADREAMLFVFERDEPWSFWMKEMNFPIDIIWLNKDKRVVHVEYEVHPDATPHAVYMPPVPSRYVLEVASGQAKASGIKVGTVAKFNLPKEGRE